MREVILNGIPQGVFSAKLTFEERHKGSEEGSQVTP